MAKERIILILVTRHLVPGPGKIPGVEYFREIDFAKPFHEQQTTTQYYYLALNPALISTGWHMLAPIFHFRLLLSTE